MISGLCHCSQQNTGLLFVCGDDFIFLPVNLNPPILLAHLSHVFFPDYNTDPFIFMSKWTCCLPLLSLTLWSFQHTLYLPSLSQQGHQVTHLVRRASTFHFSSLRLLYLIEQRALVCICEHGRHLPCILLLLWKTASSLLTESGSVQKCLIFSSRYQLWFSSTRVNIITNSRSTSVLVPEYLFRTPNQAHTGEQRKKF